MSAATKDAGTVKLGGQSPLFGKSTKDVGRVRLGGQSPLFRG